MRTILAVLVAAVSLASVLVSAHRPASQGQAKSEEYTIQEVFTAVMFGTGRAAALFPEIRPAKPTRATPATNAAAARSLQQGATSLRREGLLTQQSAATLSGASSRIAKGTGTTRRPVPVDDLANLVSQRIAERDPKFFSRFRSEISSGDQRRVQATVTDASKRVNEILVGFVKPGDDVGPPVDIGADIWINVDVFLNVDKVVNVNFALNIDQVKNQTHYWNKNFPDEASRLKNEVIINAVTTKAKSISIKTF